MELHYIIFPILQVRATAPVTTTPEIKDSASPSTPAYVWAILVIALVGVLAAIVIGVLIFLKINKKRKLS